MHWQALLSKKVGQKDGGISGTDDLTGWGAATRADSVSLIVVRDDDDGHLHDYRHIQTAAAVGGAESVNQKLSLQCHKRIPGSVPRTGKGMVAGKAIQSKN